MNIRGAPWVWATSPAVFRVQRATASLCDSPSRLAREAATSSGLRWQITNAGSRRSGRQQGGGGGGGGRRGGAGGGGGDRGGAAGVGRRGAAARHERLGLRAVEEGEVVEGALADGGARAGEVDEDVEAAGDEGAAADAPVEV